MRNDTSDLNAWLEPQERLDRLFSETFRRFGPQVVDLSYAIPRDGPEDEVRAALRRAAANMDGLALQYTPYGGRVVTRRAIAAELTREYGLPFDFRDIIMTTGAMAALNLAFHTLFGPQDQVLVLVPCWQDYPVYLRNLGIPFSLVPLDADKHLDIETIGRSLTGQTRGIIFSHPACPTGVMYTPAELDALSGLLGEAEARFGTRIYLISDEVYRHVIFSEREFVSPLQSYPRSVSVYSFGKTLALQGQRIGYIAVSPRMPDIDVIRTKLIRSVRAMGLCTPTSLMQHAVCDLLDYRPNPAALAAKQRHVREALAAFGYQICDGEATFYIYAQSPMPDAFTFAEFLASRGVLALPSTLFHERGYFRLALTGQVETIARGLPAFPRAPRAALV